jgi:multicomponent Na+:H+ antiporter subunit E
MTGHRSDVPAVMRAVVGRAALFVLLWLVLTEGDVRSPVLALLLIGASVALSLRMVPPVESSWRPLAAVRLGTFFLRESLHGGVDVALRALDPRLPIDPLIVDHRIRLPDGPARVLFVASVSLLPGTLSTRVDGATLRVHLLDRGSGAQRTVARLEDRVAAAFAVDLDRP